MATINHKTYNEGTETFKDFSVYDGKDTLIFKVDGSAQSAAVTGTLSVSGNATFDTTTLVVDAANNRVGVGTATPSYGLDTRGIAAVFNAGLDGTTQPTLYLGHPSYTTTYLNKISTSVSAAANSQVMQFSVANGASTYADVMTLNGLGNVGIGTNEPNAVLEVAGVAKATFSVLTSENSISSAAEASRFFAVSGDTGATSYNGTSIGQAGISGFGSTGIFVVGGFKPILPKGWTGTVVLEAVCNNVNFATQVFIQTSTDGSSWTTRATASVNGTLTYTASSGLSADTFLRIVLSSGSGAPVSESVCQFSNLRINSYNVLMDAFHQGEIKYPSLGIASLSGGLAFNGDTAASNALDDYEEGTWTPVFRGGTTAGNYGIGLGGGTYTKIGNQVTVYASLVNIFEASAGSGAWQISGLPYAVGSSDAFERISTGTCYVRQAAVARTGLIATSSPSSSSLFISYSNGASDIVNYDIATDFLNNMDIGLVFTYTV